MSGWVLFIVYLCAVGCFWLAGLIWWVVMFTVMGLALMAAEILSIVFRGKTLSEEFIEEKDKKPVEMFLVTASLWVFVVALTIHLWRG